MGEMAKNVGPAQTPTHGRPAERKHGTTAGTVKDPAFKESGNHRGPVSGFDGGAKRRKA